jgi:magnesium transporter
MRDRMFSSLRGTRGRRQHALMPIEPPRNPVRGGPNVDSSVVNLAVYREGHRLASPETLSELYQILRDDEHAFGWIGLYRPTPSEVISLAEEFSLHELAVEDAIVAHQRPKLERYGDTLFVVMSAARYIDETEEVEFGELHVFVGTNFVISMRHSESPDLSGVRAGLEDDPELLALGPEAVLYAILDRVVDGYLPVVAGLENDIDEIETEVFSGDPEVSRRIYELSREVIEFRRATNPLSVIFAALEGGFDKYGVGEELQRSLRDVADHNTVVCDRVDGFQQILRDMLTVNATMVAQRQNEEMRALSIASNDQNVEVKKISAWAAILFAPTLIGTIYGMNFQHMPELDWQYGYPVALTMMAAVCISLYVVFKRRDWL